MNIAHTPITQSQYAQDLKIFRMITYLEYAQKDVAKIDKHAEALLVATIKRLRATTTTYVHK